MTWCCDQLSCDEVTAVLGVVDVDTVAVVDDAVVAIAAGAASAAAIVLDTMDKKEEWLHYTSVQSSSYCCCWFRLSSSSRSQLRSRCLSYSVQEEEGVGCARSSLARSKNTTIYEPSKLTGEI